MDNNELCVQRVHKNMRLPKYLIDFANNDRGFSSFTALVEHLLFDRYKGQIEVKKIPVDYSNYDIDNIPFNTKTKVIYEKKSEV